MKKLRVVYMGTPDFAVPCLERIIADGHQVETVVTQPDRPRGRGQKVTFSPVKTAALAHGLTVLQPQTIKDPEFMASLSQIAPDLLIVVAFGQFLPQTLLQLPPLGCINVHASLLPAYRGAAPIHWAIMNGEAVSGVTTMYMDVGMDTGDMILKSELVIGENETTGVLHDRLSLIGAQLLSDTMALIASGAAPRRPQDHSIATYAPLLKRDHEKVDWTQQAKRIHDQIRGLNPWPGAYAEQNDKLVKIWGSHVVDPNAICAEPGKITAITADAIIVACGRGMIGITEVQPANKRRMAVNEFVRGYNIAVGEYFV